MTVKEFAVEYVLRHGDFPSYNILDTLLENGYLDEEEKKELTKEEKEKDRILSLPLEEVFDKGVCTKLHNYGMHKIGDVVEKGKWGLMKCKGIGGITLHVISESLDKLGVGFPSGTC